MQGPILIVEDSDAVRYLIRHILEQRDYETVEAVDGEEALVRLGEGAVRMVITDMHMPGMNGLEFVRQLRADPKHRDTPVLVVSGERDYYFQYFGRDIDAQEWIDKPFTVNHLMDAVTKYIGEGGPAVCAANVSREEGACTADSAGASRGYMAQ